MPLSILFGLLLAFAQREATLGSELLRRNLPVPGDAGDLDQPITSYSTLDDEMGFSIAYYGVEPDGALHELRVRTYDRSSRTWRRWTRAEPIGAVIGLQRGGRFLFLTGHSSPSAAPLLVLTETLQFKRELDGWPKLVLPDGRLVFVRSMVHFAPAHAEALAFYDPSTNRDVPLYPDPSVKNERGVEVVAGTNLWMDRSIETVKSTKGNTIEFSAVEQHMRLDRQMKAHPAGPERRRIVVCALAQEPVCR